MKEWFSAKELAGVAGLPTTERAIQMSAKREGWQSQKRSGRGGGSEYHISSLPAKTQTALRISAAKRAVSTETTQAIVAEEHAKETQRLSHVDAGNRAYLGLNGKAKKRADAKLHILTLCDEFMQLSGLAGRKGTEAFVDAFKAGDVALPSWVTSIVADFSVSIIYNWRKKEREGGAAALAGNYGNHRKGSGMIDSQQALLNYVVGMLVENPHIQNAVLLKAIYAEFNGTSISLPSKRSLDRWVRDWKQKNQQVYTAVTNPDAWKNKYMAAPGSASEHVTALNQLWEFDATPADVMLTDGRHSISGVIDVYSRRLKLIVTRTSNSKAVAQVIRSAILDWGVPEIAKTDNGADYKSRYIRAVFERLHIEQEFCPPFQGWKKPHIERAFRTFSHDVAELLPGFIGHNVAERKAIESRKAFSDRLFEKDTVIDVQMSSSELQVFCDQWVENIYHRTAHSSLRKSPIEMVRAWSLPIRQVEDERLLDVLLSEPAGTRTVTKKGIRLDNSLFIHPDLWALAGEEVQVFYDDSDMGRVYVYDLEGQFVCIAEDPEITGISRTEVAAKAKEVQRAAVQEERRRLKAAARKVTRRDVAQQILDHRAEEARKEKTIEFPKRAERHDGEGIRAAQDALGSMHNRSAVPEQQPEIVARAQAAMVTLHNQTPDTPAETPQQRYQRWVRVDQAINNGEPVDQKQQRWWQGYQQTSEFRAEQRMAENFGLAASAN